MVKIINIGLLSGLLLTLILIFWQDYKYFKVSLVLYILCFIIIGVRGLIHIPIRDFGITFAINILLLCIQLALVWLYLIITKRKLKSFFEYIGEGDILFFVILAISFSNLNFIVFQIISLIVILTVHLAVQMYRKRKLQVPLAGYQALLLALCMVYDYFCCNLACYRDIMFNL